MTLEARIKIVEIGGIDFELVKKDTLDYSCEGCVFKDQTEAVEPYCREAVQWCANTNILRLPENSLCVYTEEVNTNRDLFKPNKLYRAEQALAIDMAVYLVDEKGSDICLTLEGVSAHTDSQWRILQNPE